MKAIGTIDLLIFLTKATTKIGGFVISQSFNAITGVFFGKSDKEIVELQQPDPPPLLDTYNFIFELNLNVTDMLKEWVSEKVTLECATSVPIIMVTTYMACKLLSKCREIPPEEAVKIASSPDICTNGYYYPVGLVGDEA